MPLDSYYDVRYYGEINIVIQQIEQADTTGDGYYPSTMGLYNVGRMVCEALWTAQYAYARRGIKNLVVDVSYSRNGSTSIQFIPGEQF